MTKELACSFNYLNAFRCMCVTGSFFFLSLQVDWTPELHKKFVQAVEQLGVDQAIPSRILELMKVEGLTRHNVASHLQVSVNFAFTALSDIVFLDNAISAQCSPRVTSLRCWSF